MGYFSRACFPRILWYEEQWDGEDGSKDEVEGIARHLEPQDVDVAEEDLVEEEEECDRGEWVDVNLILVEQR